MYRYREQKKELRKVPKSASIVMTFEGVEGNDTVVP